MGLHVTDDDEYQKYRQGMVPILESYGASFRFDFKIAEVLISESDCEINRVFVIDFPSKGKMDQFFADPNYLAVRNRHYEASVSESTIISLHQQNR